MPVCMFWYVFHIFMFIYWSFFLFFFCLFFSLLYCHCQLCGVVNRVGDTIYVQYDALCVILRALFNALYWCTQMNRMNVIGEIGNINWQLRRCIVMLCFYQVPKENRRYLIPFFPTRIQYRLKIKISLTITNTNKRAIIKVSIDVYFFLQFNYTFILCAIIQHFVWSILLCFINELLKKNFWSIKALPIIVLNCC